jgi:AraC-like DNA-binding protein
MAVALPTIFRPTTEGRITAAQRFGYCDQSHLARGFHFISGTTITDYRLARGFAIDYGFAREGMSHSSKT